MQLLQYQPPGKLGGLFVGRDNRVLLMPLRIQNALSEEITADMVRRPRYFKSGGSFKSAGCDASCALRIKGKSSFQEPVLGQARHRYRRPSFCSRLSSATTFGYDGLSSTLITRGHGI